MCVCERERKSDIKHCHHAISLFCLLSCTTVTLLPTVIPKVSLCHVLRLDVCACVCMTVKAQCCHATSSLRLIICTAVTLLPVFAPKVNLCYVLLLYQASTTGTCYIICTSIAVLFVFVFLVSGLNNKYDRYLYASATLTFPYVCDSIGSVQ